MRPWRIRFFMTLAPLVVLALASFWLYEVMRRATDTVLPSPQRSEPDFYVEKFSYVKLSKTGAAKYHVAGDRLTHNPQDDSYDIVKPVMRNISNPEAPTTIRAERGSVNSDNSKVHLYDNVQMDRPATPTSQSVHIRTEYMLVLPDDDVMKTDRPVEITTDRARLTGTGMLANNATRELNLTSNVHGTYQARQR
ncbi:LPS export ABC transporter periplasmic protein LptC [Noviherbaspirillum denitrificans]|uniref:LPS export ABC transporter periplasmic protein LptC n=1 Tax=Noviherbaspirillum denitrificans TaxID=1968433 RepID=A0A254TRI0_9BURK|nr:LPS export ABC transporter periplasmic protein LptC [Noviherbaspirillum denitrificans]OWW22338.1 LPS export ABC transporter periplasmic protein LptC [Noviherbaspirillum denitrificans]